MSLEKAIVKINEHGALLVFPIKNKKEPKSLWNQLYPRSTMRWEWDDSGDNRVVNLWHMMKELSVSREVVYSKWYQNRATFFSKDIFKALLAQTFQHLRYEPDSGLSHEAREIFEILRNDSPLSTKEIKEACGLKGRLNESLYNRAMKELYHRFLIVGFGEKEDGAFPSSMMGATQLLFEEEWIEAQSVKPQQAEKTLHRYWNNSSPFLSYFRKHLTSKASLI